VCGAAVRTPGWPLIVSALPGRCAVLAEAALAAADLGLAGATGPIGEVDAFAAAYVARTGKAVEVVLRLWVFVLGALRPPSGVSGAARRAGERDVGLVAAWRLAFDEEALGDRRAGRDPRASAQPALSPEREFLLWEVDGTPVALAGAGLPVAGMSRVSSVYTPPEHRGCGYGSAVTAAVSAWALAAGARDVVLFTDLANPVTNAIYPRIGYRPMHDALELAFR
jgi:GNAT superfamily N-acetyltransferase